MATPDQSGWTETPLLQSGEQNTPPAQPTQTPQGWEETPIQQGDTTGDAAAKVSSDQDRPEKALEGAYNMTLGPLASLAKSVKDYYTKNNGEHILAGGDPIQLLKDAATDEDNPLHIVAKGIAQSHMDEAKRTKQLVDEAMQAAKEGKESLAATLLQSIEIWGHTLATVVPVIGPAAAHAGGLIGGEARAQGSQAPVSVAPRPWEGFGEAGGLIGSTLVHPAISKARSVLGETLANSVRPEFQDTASGAKIPVRNTSRLGQAAAQSVDKEIPTRMTAQQTAPAVAKGIGTVAGRASEAGGKYGAYNGVFNTPEEATVPSASDRFGLRGHANNLIENQATPVYKALDDLSDGKFSEAQEIMRRTRGKFTPEMNDAYTQAEADKNAIIDQYKDQLQSQGMSAEDADAAYRKGTAIQKIADKLDQATGPSEIEGTDYSISGKKLAKAFDDLVKKSGSERSLLKRAGFTDEHISQVQELADILKNQEDVPRVSSFMKGAARGLVAMTGLTRGGIVGAAEALTGESLAERVGQKAANKLFGEALTSPAMAKDLTDAVKSGDATSFIDKLKNSPMSGAIKNTVQRLWSEETGEAGAPGGVGKTAAQSADDFNKARGRNEVQPVTAETHPQTKEIADAYERMQHNPEDPDVKNSYDALKKGVDEQWDHAVADGFKFEPWDEKGQPYKNSKEMKADVDNNRHLYFFRGGDIPADHPLAEVDPKTGLTYNEKLRAVHDLYGHAASGYEFGPKGEEAAYKTHAQMFDPEAIPALTTETRGQNNWVNSGKHLRNEAGDVIKKGESGYVPPTERPFAEQKAGILPKDFQGDHTVDVMNHIKDDKPFAVLTAENPMNQRLTDAENAKLNDRLVQDLRNKGYHPVEVQGMNSDVEGKTEHSYFVPNITVEDVAELGKKYRQASVLTHEGLYDLQKNTVNPSDNGGLLTGDRATEEPYYSVINGHPFSVPLDFNREVPSSLKSGGVHEVTTRTPTGEAQGHLVASDTTVPGEAQVKSHWVAPEVQGQGIGSSQIEQLAKRLAEDPSRRTLLSDDDMTEGAIGAWRKLQAKYPQAVSEYEGANGDPRFRFNLDALRPEDASQYEIGTARPRSTKVTDTHDPQQIINGQKIEDIVKKNPQFGEKLAASIAKYRGVALDPSDYEHPAAIINKFVDQMSSNLEWLYNQVPDAIKGPARKWYKSANTSIIKPWASQYGYEPKQIAGAIAALSPQNPWENNVGTVKTILDTLKDKSAHEWTDNMESQGLDLSKGKPELRKIFKAIRGKTLGELTEPVERAMWIRLLDETEGSGKNNVYSPEGQVTGVDDRARAWSSIDTIAKALRILDDGSMQSIHENLGYGHKVRNFYNNLINPDGKNGHVTIDTHAVAAAHAQPLGGLDPEVGHNFGSSPKGVPGVPKNGPEGVVSSTYPLYAEAYRRVAQKLGIPVHELQSSVWEGARSLFGDKKGPEVGLVKAVWQDYKDGKISLDEARQKTIDYNGGFKKPNWMSQSDWDKSQGTDFNFGGENER